jgi:xanthine dehydrogenase YagS FAD-binding subunit
LEPGAIAEAVDLCLARPSETQFIAGGTDLLTEIKEGVANPKRLVGLSAIPGLQEIQETEDGLSIGAMTTIAEVAEHPVIRSGFAALAEAAAGLATPQIRNLATLGGNLNQRPRCWYYRHPLTVCLKKGGDRCYALAGDSRYLCVTGGEGCYIVHPSDTAVALTALGALVEIAGPSGLRVLPLEQFFAGPSRDLTRENVLGPGELVTRVILPTLPVSETSDSSRTSVYLKAREREGGDFALVSAAMVWFLSGASIAHASLVLGGVAPVPYRATQVEQYLIDRPLHEVNPEHAASLALPQATPMPDNAYKVVLASNLVKQAIRLMLQN